MKLQALKTNEALNKAFLKLPLTRSQIEKFKANYKTLLNHYNPSEREEYHKNVISEFLRETYYSPDYYINTKGGYDLVIHNGKDNKSSVGVIIECKSPGNSAEMPVIDNLKSKALYELILYYLRERITNQNLELKHLIITNLFDWFIFDAHEFEKHFANNKSLVKQFRDFEEGRLSGKDTSFFYSSIADPFVNGITEEFKFTYFSLQSFASIIKNDLLSDDHKLIPPFKILSPEHLLKLKFKNDSNSLDKDFYLELLHIIGLEDIKKGGKSLIGRAIPERRNYGSLLESTITTLQAEDLLSQIDNLSNFGPSRDEQLFNISLDLVITWINRILFLKLLESQLIRYNRGDKNFVFLDQTNVPDFDALNKLFFYVLAIPVQERESLIKEKFINIPYLNSSLFEATELERKTIRVSNLDNSYKIPVSKNSVLKDHVGKRRSGEINTLQYLFEFLDSYDFSSEGGKKIQEENKALINASVLGLIFEKINGYKDGSFFTPGYITQHICQETIIKSVIQKFNEIKGWDCQTVTDLHNKIENKFEANSIINSLKICDPAVGSGHFLVSALNEIIAIKSELRILIDRNGKLLRDYRFEVVNDELIISDPDGELFEYNPRNLESQRVQEAIFHEKQALIEGSLFGVDINPNSVKICRLRLWIELLKHSYYRQESLMQELETLPNIDINIKCGNSLVSRYSLDANITDALKSSRWTVDNYREAVMLYRNANTKDQKNEMKKLISEIKSNFESVISTNDKRFLRLNKIKGELLSLTTQQGLFELNSHEKEKWNKKVNKLTQEEKGIEKQLQEIKNNKFFSDAFEWRFEFPEVLDENGNFVGFDVILGNPPYYSLSRDIKYELLSPLFKTFEKSGDIYCLFYELGHNLLKNKMVLGYISSNKWMRSHYGESLRHFLSSNVSIIQLFDFDWFQVFDNASVDTCLVIFTKTLGSSLSNAAKADSTFNIHSISDYINVNSRQVIFPSKSYWSINDNEYINLKIKLVNQGRELKKWELTTNYGIKTGLNKAFIIDQETRNRLLKLDPNNDHLIKPLLRGRDIERYGYNFCDQWIIFTQRGIDIDLYPSIKAHLEQFREELEPKISPNQKVGRKPGPYKWFEIQDTVSYYHEFEKEKIIWAETMRIHKSGDRNFPRFGYDNTGKYTDKTTFIGIGPKVKYLLAFFNSKVGRWLVTEFVTKLDSGGYMMQKIFLDEIPVFTPDEKQEESIIEIVNQILKSKSGDYKSNTIDLEQTLDHLFFSYYDLTLGEIEIIEHRK